jgi:hypothetical protein
MIYQNRASWSGEICSPQTLPGKKRLEDNPFVVECL